MTARPRAPARDRLDVTRARVHDQPHGRHAEQTAADDCAADLRPRGPDSGDRPCRARQLPPRTSGLVSAPAVRASAWTTTGRSSAPVCVRTMRRSARSCSRQDCLSTLIELDPSGTSAEVIGAMIDYVTGRGGERRPHPPDGGSRNSDRRVDGDRGRVLRRSRDEGLRRGASRYPARRRPPGSPAHRVRRDGGGAQGADANGASVRSPA